MRARRGVATIALVLVACGPRPAPAPIGATATAPPAQPDCDGAQAQYERVLAAQADQIEGDARAQAQTRIAAMQGITAQRCRDDAWTAEIATCLRGATTDAEQQACALMMRPDQHRRWFLHLLNGQAPAAATADDKAGPSCVQIEASWNRMFEARAASAAQARADDQVLAQRWAAQILFERCLVDGWPESARTCFNRADPEATCEQMLSESARTSLNDHLVDMAESLGVPY
jgi:hypothetical protein